MAKSVIQKLSSLKEIKKNNPPAKRKPLALADFNEAHEIGAFVSGAFAYKHVARLSDNKQALWIMGKDANGKFNQIVASYPIAPDYVAVSFELDASGVHWLKIRSQRYNLGHGHQLNGYQGVYFEPVQVSGTWKLEFIGADDVRPARAGFPAINKRKIQTGQQTEIKYIAANNIDFRYA